jgi:glycosyltransferase involved in cell wall biosynthesis
LKLPVSAIIVGLNESKLLKNSLQSVKFCDEIVYVDLGSNDNSIQIASIYANKIIEYKLVPSGEYAHAEFVPTLKYDWVLYIDPDEIIDPQLEKKIIEIFPSIDTNKNIASVSVPWQFYFKKIKLIGTPWGLENRKPILANRTRFIFEPITHYGRRNKDGYISYEIPFETNLLLHHYWVQSWAIFISKHLRYLKNEGKDRYNIGSRTNFFRLFLNPFLQFKYSFITCRGYKNKSLGLFLAFFWTTYQFLSEFSLFLYQRKIK